MFTVPHSEKGPIVITTMDEIESMLERACQKSADIALKKYIGQNDVGLSPQQLVEKLGGEGVITTNTIVQYCNKYADTTEGLVVFKSFWLALVTAKCTK